MSNNYNFRSVISSSDTDVHQNTEAKDPPSENQYLPVTLKKKSSNITIFNLNNTS